MGQNYFEELHDKTATRFWINNPSSQDVSNALKADVHSCTTNPAYCSKLIQKEKEYIDSVIDHHIHYSNNYDNLAKLVYRSCAKRVMDSFMPIFDKSNGDRGFVTLQDDPRCDADTDHIVNNILENKELSPNYMAKIPVIDGGIQAIEECVKHNVPICATEVFSVSQAVLIAERYKSACKRYNNNPPIFITHISGIFDEYLLKIANRRNIDVDPELIKVAGIALARQEFKRLKESGYNITMLGGGARAIHHFTGLVGGPHITINWSTASELLESNIDVKNVINEKVPENAIFELRTKFSEFARAYEDDGMAVQEFADYGPVQLFRNSFMKGWFHLLTEIADRKHINAQ